MVYLVHAYDFGDSTRQRDDFITESDGGRRWPGIVWQAGCRTTRDR